MEPKACALVIRKVDSQPEILLFRHADAGIQIVKGGRKGCETPIQTAVRELFEESGLEATGGHFLGQVDQPEWNQTWALILCNVTHAQDAWTWETIDDHGHAFSFFWHPFNEEAPDEMSTPFKRAYKAARSYLR